MSGQCDMRKILKFVLTYVRPAPTFKPGYILGMDWAVGVMASGQGCSCALIYVHDIRIVLQYVVLAVVIVFFFFAEKKVVIAITVINVVDVVISVIFFSVSPQGRYCHCFHRCYRRH